MSYSNSQQIQFWHHTIKTVDQSRPFLDRGTSLEIWRRLRFHYPRVIACMLMPNHIHLVMGYSSGHAIGYPTRDPSALNPNALNPNALNPSALNPSGRHSDGRHSNKKTYGDTVVNLSRIVTQHDATRAFRWQETRPHAPISDLKHLLRTVKYVHLNPCRQHLVKDPLEWEFSTHRDYLGLVADPWPKSDAIFKLLKMRDQNHFHKYVSSDFTVTQQGTSLPNSQPTLLLSAHETDLIHRAAQILRESHDHQKVVRLTACYLWNSCEWSGPKISRLLGIQPKSVYRIVQRAGSTHSESLAQKDFARLMKIYLADARLGLVGGCKDL